MRQLLLLLLTIWSGSSLAVMVTDLYQVDVAVADQTQDSRAEGMKHALEKVLVKVSGRNAVLENDIIQQRVASAADRYVKSFRYGRDEVDESVRLEVLFAANLVDKLLREAGLPIWGKSRPLLLSWQAIEEQNERSLLNQSSGVWSQLIEREMTARGLPVLWPTLDLEDELVLPLEKLWGLFKQDIRVASSRYQADAVLAGRLSPDAEQGWHYQGILLHQNQSLALQATGEGAEQALAQVAGQIAEYFAAQYAVKTDNSYQPQGYQLQVEGIQSFVDYHELLVYLGSKVAINSVQLLQVDNTRLTLALDLAADWDQVWSVLALDKRLYISDENGVLRWGQ